MVRELDLNVNYTREGFPRDRELYKDSPIKVLVDMPECVRDTVLRVRLSRDGVRVCNEDGELVFKGGFSELVSLGDYNISIEKVDTLANEGDEIRVDLFSFKTVTNKVYKQLTVSILEKNTSAVRMSVKDAIPERGKDMLDALIRGYNNNGITDKQLVSAKTVEFINDRLKVINRELGDIESDAEAFKKQNQLTDITSDAAFVMERKKAAEAELLKLATELDVVKSVRDYLDNREGEEFRLLPEQLGLTDESLNNGIGKYNEMVLRRGKLLLSARESNPDHYRAGNAVTGHEKQYPGGDCQRGKRVRDQGQEPAA